MYKHVQAHAAVNPRLLDLFHLCDFNEVGRNQSFRWRSSTSTSEPIHSCDAAPQSFSSQPHANYTILCIQLFTCWFILYQTYHDRAICLLLFACKAKHGQENRTNSLHRAKCGWQKSVCWGPDPRPEHKLSRRSVTTVTTVTTVTMSFVMTRERCQTQYTEQWPNAMLFGYFAVRLASSSLVLNILTVFSL